MIDWKRGFEQRSWKTISSFSKECFAFISIPCSELYLQPVCVALNCVSAFWKNSKSISLRHEHVAQLCRDDEWSDFVMPLAPKKDIRHRHGFKKPNNCAVQKLVPRKNSDVKRKSVFDWNTGDIAARNSAVIFDSVHCVCQLSSHGSNTLGVLFLLNVKQFGTLGVIIIKQLKTIINCNNCNFYKRIISWRSSEWKRTR